MTIEIAREAGACFGVQRALDLAKKLSAEVSGPLYTLGPLIHNPRVVADLEAHGVKAIEDARKAGEGATMLLRTHGAYKEKIEATISAHATMTYDERRSTLLEILHSNDGRIIDVPPSTPAIPDHSEDADD